MELHNLEKIKLDRKNKRVGRGRGSGKGGHTVGKGQKGQKSRKGAKPNLGFEGGQSPLYKRLPKIGGFKNRSLQVKQTINFNVFNKFKDGEEITPQKLFEKKIIKKISSDGVKVLSKGDISKKVVLSGFEYSEKAKQKLENFGVKINA